MQAWGRALTCGVWRRRARRRSVMMVQEAIAKSQGLRGSPGPGVAPPPPPPLHQPPPQLPRLSLWLCLRLCPQWPGPGQPGDSRQPLQRGASDAGRRC